MFIIRFLRWLLGWVEFEAEGGFPERLLNLAARGGIPLWDTGRRGVVLTARCFARKYKKLRPIARKAGVRLHVVRRHGVPFFRTCYRARAGLVAGLATYVVLLQILSQQIWVMQVSGNRKVSEADILSVMEELGVHKGGRMKDLDIQALQIEALQKLPDLVWLTVNPEGAIAHIEVAERQPAARRHRQKRPLQHQGIAGRPDRAHGGVWRPGRGQGRGCSGAGDAAGQRRGGYLRRPGHAEIQRQNLCGNQPVSGSQRSLEGDQAAARRL